MPNWENKEKNRIDFSSFSLGLEERRSMFIILPFLALFFLCRVILQRPKEYNVVFSTQKRVRSNAMMILFSYNSSNRKKQKRNVRMQQGTHSLHKKNTQDCMSVFRSSLFFSFFFFYLTTHRSSSSSSYLFHLCRCRQRESRYSTQCLDNDVMCLYICVPFSGNGDVLPPIFLLMCSIIYRFMYSTLPTFFAKLHVRAWLYHISGGRKKRK